MLLALSVLALANVGFSSWIIVNEESDSVGVDVTAGDLLDYYSLLEFDVFDYCRDGFYDSKTTAISLSDSIDISFLVYFDVYGSGGDLYEHFLESSDGVILAGDIAISGDANATFFSSSTFRFSCVSSYYSSSGSSAGYSCLSLLDLVQSDPDYARSFSIALSPDSGSFSGFEAVRFDLSFSFSFSDEESWSTFYNAISTSELAVKLSLDISAS